MGFQKLPSNSKAFLDALVNADNPGHTLCDRWEAATGKELDEIKGIIRELRQMGYIDVKFADNKPYIVTLSNAARTYNEQLAEYEANAKQQAPAYHIDQSVTIGNGNKIKGSTIAGKVINNMTQKTSGKQKFSEKHPILLNIIIGMGTGLVLMFSFWDSIIDWIEGLF